MLLQIARDLASIGEDSAAKAAYLDLLRTDPRDFSALNELAALANATGHRSAARSAYQQAVLLHPRNPVGRVNLGNLLFEDGEIEAARHQFQAALQSDPDFPLAHQGIARVLAEFAEDTPDHWRRGFAGHAVVRKPCRGRGLGVPILLLVSARGGNIPTRHWIDDRCYNISAIYPEFFDPTGPLPTHRLIVNAIGDADLSGDALLAADALVARSRARVINPPARVLATGRASNAARLAALSGITAPRITSTTRAELLLAAPQSFPFLVRVPGRHTGQHFVRIADQAALAPALASLPGNDFLCIEYLDARGPDGYARKYRVMTIGGELYPIHLALSRDWKVHYFTADMAEHPSHRAEEARFLSDMPAILGPRALRALTAIAETLGLDYAGIDFALSPDGALLLFEANATMVLNPPDPAPIWAYRRPALQAALQAARDVLIAGAL